MVDIVEENDRYEHETRMPTRVSLQATANNVYALRNVQEAIMKRKIITKKKETEGCVMLPTGRWAKLKKCERGKSEDWFETKLTKSKYCD